MLKKLIIFMFMAFATNAMAYDIPKMQGHINDYAGVLSESKKVEFNDRLTKIMNTYLDNPEVAFLLIPSVPPEGIDQYSNDVARSWQLGKAGKDNGLLVVIAPTDHKMRVEVGYGLEAIIPDVTSKTILSAMKSDLKNYHYDAAVNHAIDKISNLLPVTAEDAKKKETDSDHGLFFFIIFIAFLIVMIFVLGMINSFRSRREKYNKRERDFVSNIDDTISRKEKYRNNVGYQLSNSPYVPPKKRSDPPKSKSAQSSHKTKSNDIWVLPIPSIDSTPSWGSSSSDSSSSSSDSSSSSSSSSDSSWSSGGGGDFGGGGSSDSW